MRIIFGVLSLLLVLAIVGSLAKKQLQAINGSVTTRAVVPAGDANPRAPAGGDRDGASLGIPGGMPAATAAETSGLTVRQESQNLQQRMRDDTARALQQGADRNARALQ